MQNKYNQSCKKVDSLYLLVSVSLLGYRQNPDYPPPPPTPTRPSTSPHHTPPPLYGANPVPLRPGSNPLKHSFSSLLGGEVGASERTENRWQGKADMRLLEPGHSQSTQHRMSIVLIRTLTARPSHHFLGANGKRPMNGCIQ